MVAVFCHCKAVKMAVAIRFFGYYGLLCRQLLAISQSPNLDAFIRLSAYFSGTPSYLSTKIPIISSNISATTGVTYLVCFSFLPRYNVKLIID